MENLSQEFYQNVADQLNDIDQDCGAEVYENYSGRAMYGKTVTAISTESPTPHLQLAIMVSAATHFFDDWVDANGDESDAYDVVEFMLDFHNHHPNLLCRRDNLGTGEIYY